MKIHIYNGRINKLKKVGYKVYSLIYRRPHQYLVTHSALYRRWQNFRFHRHVRLAVTTLASLAAVLLVIGAITHNAFALTTWIQSDWSGGIGSSTTNQYSAATSVTTSTPNQVTLSGGTNLITNPNFSSNLNGWSAGVAPNSIGGLVAWYKADAITGVANGSAVNSWADSSGNGYTLTQNTAADQPLYEVLA